MIPVFRVCSDCLISIEYNSELLNHVPKNGKSWQGEIRPIIIKLKTPNYRYISVWSGLPIF